MRAIRVRTLMELGWRLARAGGRGRWITIVAGSALTTALLLFAVAVPRAVREAGIEVTASERLQSNQLSLLFALPVLALLFTVLRLSSTTRDQRLAGLRLLGLGPSDTRLVAAVEGSSTAALGAAAGVFLYTGVAAGTTFWGWEAQWLRQPLDIGFLQPLVTLALIVAVAMIVAIAPTRGISADPRRARSEARMAKPSPWRLVPLVTAVALLLWMVVPDHRNIVGSGLLPGWWTALMLASWALAGLSVPLATPALGRGIAAALARQHWWLTGKLAGRRLQVEPASAARPIAGLSLATYSSVVVLMFLALITQGSGRFTMEKAYLEQGPQPITLKYADGSVPLPIAASEIATIPGVRHVVPMYSIGSDYLTDGVSCMSDEADCLPVFVGTCEDLAQFQVITGCRGDAAQRVQVPWTPDPWNGRSPDEITVRAGGEVTVPFSEERVDVDERLTEERFASTSRFTGVFIPVTASGVAEVLGEPRGFSITADGGRDVRAELGRFAADHGMVAISPSSKTYENTMLGRAGLLSLVTAIVVIGLLTVGVGMVDRAVERRRAVASLVVIGTPPRVLRWSQLVQVATMLTVAVLPALTAGQLAAQSFVVTQELEGMRVADRLSVTQSVQQLAVPLLVGCAAVALATLPGAGARLRPESLRNI